MKNFAAYNFFRPIIKGHININNEKLIQPKSSEGIFKLSLKLVLFIVSVFSLYPNLSIAQMGGSCSNAFSIGRMPMKNVTQTSSNLWFNILTLNDTTEFVIQNSDTLPVDSIYVYSGNCGALTLVGSFSIPASGIFNFYLPTH